MEKFNIKNNQKLAIAKFNHYEFFKEMYYHVFNKYVEYEDIIENDPKCDFIGYFLSNLITAMRFYGTKKQCQEIYDLQLRLFE